MHRFHVPPRAAQGRTIALTDAEAHHAARVLRVQPGEIVTVLDGAGQEIRCEVQSADKRAVTLKVLERKQSPPLPSQITLLQAVPKGKIIESIIQKGTELGVHRVVPLLTERVATRLDAAAAAAKGTQWQEVAVEAIKQCGAAWLPRVEAPQTLAQYLERKESFDLALVGALQGEAQHPRRRLGEFREKHGSVPKSVAVWIGPEGDLTAAELEAIKQSGALPISLGRLVLRVETAAVFCLSFLNYELQIDDL